MMASIGLVGQHFIKFPSLEDVPSGFGALVDGKGLGAFLALAVSSGVLELAWRQESNREPGNYGNPFGIDMYNRDMRNKEISNGRMAMISVLGIFAAGLATGKDAMQQFGLSALAASDEGAVAPFNPAEQVGAVAPFGYFDPMGFTKVGDEAGFRTLREQEIKHGRVAMMASIGLVGQHFIKFPSLEDVPAGFGALADGKGLGAFVALAVSSGVLELAWRQESNREPGNYGNPFGIDMYNRDVRNKEISNGRMAMISVLGIFAAELATGKDAMQQFGLSALAASDEGAVAPFNPAEQVGAVAPLGYFDPMGFTKVGDEAGFRTLREQEIKHGRVAMMASIGLVGQHFIKFPS